MPTKRWPIFAVAALILLVCVFFARKSASSEDGANLRANLEEVRSLLDSWQGDSSVLEEARTKLDSILLEHPDSAETHREYSRYHIMDAMVNSQNFKAESLKAAEESLNTALRLNPKYAEAYVLAGHLYLLEHDSTRARAALARADELGTKDPWLDLNWADVLKVEKKFDEAATRYKKVIASNTKNAKAMRAAYSGLVDCYLETGQLAEADKGYKQLIDYAPESAWNHGNYASFLLCTKDDADAAIVEFRQALNLMDYGVALHGLAAALYRNWAKKVFFHVIEKGDASPEYDEAKSLADGSPIQVVLGHCCSGPAVAFVSNVVPIDASAESCSSNQ